MAGGVGSVFIGRRRGRVRRLGLIATGILGLAAAGPVASPGAAAGGGDAIGPVLGSMPDGPTLPRRRLLAPLIACPQPAPNAGCNMTYHNGDLVIGPHTVRIVYWDPGASIAASYKTLLERYLQDVAADSGRATNVYATDTQYTDSSSNAIQYAVTWGGAFTDTTAFPGNLAGCPTTDGTITITTCLTQTQQSSRLDSFIQAQGLPRGLNNIYFMVLPQNVETCDDGI